MSRNPSSGLELVDSHVANRIDAAPAKALEAVYLLTTTAADYFRGLGFASASREAVPAELAASPEFAGACPASATCSWRIPRIASVRPRKVVLPALVSVMYRVIEASFIGVSTGVLAGVWVEAARQAPSVGRSPSAFIAVSDASAGGNDGGVVVRALRYCLVRMHAHEPAPVGGRLIIDEDVRLGQESREATLDAKFARGVLGVVGSTRAPAIQHESRGERMAIWRVGNS
ncbi:hypothetical protein WMF45_11955 [Sorangium sp. So ce448]|uniref:hypothetical protein n=1 Tax=Sorangium sp. So ce448 TaxID=3133314 RepID=UPI003F5E227F